MDNTQAASQNTLEKLSTALESGTFVDVRRMLNGLPAADVAHLLESSPPNYRHILWQMVEVEREGEVLGELSDDLQAHFLSDMGAAEVAMITEGLEDDDIADILQQVPDRITREVLNAMDYQDRARLERVIQYPDDIAGGLMNTDTITEPGGPVHRPPAPAHPPGVGPVSLRARDDGDGSRAHSRRYARHRGGTPVRTQRLGVGTRGR